jgi:glycerophosphoryl diester phosphodiesterase
MSPGTPRIVAHRTCPRDAPENSIAGIQRASSLGADAVEMDVRITADGVPVLMHDASAGRTTGARRTVRRCSSTEIAKLRLANGEKVPTLSDALAALPAGLDACLDVKDRAAVDAALTVITRHGLERRTRIWSQHTRVIEITRARAPGLRTALLRDARSRFGVYRFLRDAVRCRAHAISAHWDVVGPELRRRCRTLDLEFAAWCTSPRLEVTKAELLDDLVTDWPRECRVELARHGCGAR